MICPNKHNAPKAILRLGGQSTPQAHVGPVHSRIRRNPVSNVSNHRTLTPTPSQTPTPTLNSRGSSRNSSSLSNHSSNMFLNTSTNTSTMTNTHNSLLQPHSLFQTLSLKSVLLRPRTIPIPRWITPKHYSITLSECLGHSSFLLVAASYYAEDFIVLRTIAVMGSTAMVFFVYFHPNGKVLWLPFRWNMLFIIINLYRIGHTYYEHYFAERHLSPLYKKIREDHYWNMDPVDFYKLIRLGKEEVYSSGDLILSQGCQSPHIRLVLEGKLDVLRDGLKTYSLEEGNFISESGLHAGLFLTGMVESNCTIVAAAHSHASSDTMKSTDTQERKSSNDTPDTDRNTPSNSVTSNPHLHSHVDDIGNVIINTSAIIATLSSPPRIEIHSHPNPQQSPQDSPKHTQTVRLLRWDRTELMQLLSREKHLRSSLKAALTWDIVRKLKGQRQMLARHEVSDPELWTVKRNEQNEDRYAAILQNMLSHPEYFTQRKRELDKYRIIHHIDDEHHRIALQKCGWTVEEYNLGKKIHLEPIMERNHDPLKNDSNGMIHLSCTSTLSTSTPISSTSLSTLTTMDFYESFDIWIMMQYWWKAWKSRVKKLVDNIIDE